MKFIFYLALAIVIFWVIKNFLTSKSKSVSGKMKVTALINGKPVKTPKDTDRLMKEHEESQLGVDPSGKNDGLNIDNAEAVAKDRNETVYKTPDGKWFNVYQLPKGERSYQRLTPWEARNRIKTQHMGSREDCEALLAKHDLTGTKDELHIKDVPNFAPRKYIPLDEQKKRR
jgi:hypothetical protein